MAITKWVTIGAKRCDLTDLNVELKELRVFPANDFLRAMGNEHRVRYCTCSAAIDCNMAGVPCRWALNRSGSNRF